ncbi:MAG: hypothetical protein R3C01_01005 [Planctomycetaceae bacterium]
MQLKTWEPWTLEDCPEMADWLTQNEAAIDLIGKALRQPTFCMPLCPNDDGSTTLYPLNQNSSVLRVYARALQERANYWVAIGEADKAIDDAISIRRLGRLISHNGTLIEHLAGITFSGMSVGVPIAGSLERQPSEAQLRRFLDETNNLPPNPKFVDAVFWEQSSFCDYLQRVALARELDLTELGAEVPWSHLPLSHDWNIVAEEASTVFEDARRGTTTPIVPVTAAVLFRRTRSQEVANKLRASYGNMFTAVREAFHRMDCQDNLLRIVSPCSSLRKTTRHIAAGVFCRCTGEAAS